MAKDLRQTIRRRLGEEVLLSLSETLDAEVVAVSEALEAALRTLLARLAENTATANGAAELHASLERDHGGDLFESFEHVDEDTARELIDSILSSPAPTSDSFDGRAILENVFRRERSDAETAIASTTDLEPRQISDLLTFLAPVAMSALGQELRVRKLTPEQLRALLEESAGS